MKVALVVGAFGITGFNLIKHLAEAGRGREWKIYGVAKREFTPEDAPKGDNVHYVSVDISDHEQCRQKLGRLADVTHLFYVAWVRKTDENEMTELNVRMFKNVLTIVDSACDGLQHVILQTGTKYYGSHKGPFKTPAHEDDPRHEGPNFYFGQEDFLRQYHDEKDKSWSWNVFRPCDIIGIGPAKSNQMNLGVSLAVYACIQRELGESFDFPGKVGCWDAWLDNTDVDLLCRMMLWAINDSSGRVKNQPFNCVNGGKFKWRDMWKVIGDYFGVPSGSEPKPRSLEKEMQGKEDVWNKMVDKYGLQKNNLFDIGTWWFADMELAREWDVHSSMDRARALGFQERVDDTKMFYSLFKQLEDKKIIPPKAKPTA